MLDRLWASNEQIPAQEEKGARINWIPTLCQAYRTTICFNLVDCFYFYHNYIPTQFKESGNCIRLVKTAISSPPHPHCSSSDTATKNSSSVFKSKSLKTMLVLLLSVFVQCSDFWVPSLEDEESAPFPLLFPLLTHTFPPPLPILPVQFPLDPAWTGCPVMLSA